MERRPGHEIRRKEEVAGVAFWLTALGVSVVSWAVLLLAGRLVAEFEAQGVMKGVGVGAVLSHPGLAVAFCLSSLIVARAGRIFFRMPWSILDPLFALYLAGANVFFFTALSVVAIGPSAVLIPLSAAGAWPVIVPLALLAHVAMKGVTRAFLPHPDPVR